MPNSLSKLNPWTWYILALIILVLDQWTKSIAAAHLQYNIPEAVNSFFNFTLRYNYGVAFSMFDDHEGSQRWVLAALAFVVSVGIVVWIYKIGKKSSLEVLGLALVLGGAIGNLYDRVMLGYVIDFIDVHYQNHHWPAFNIADSAICGGAALLLFDGFFGASKKKASEEK